MQLLLGRCHFNTKLFKTCLKHSPNSSISPAVEPYYVNIDSFQYLQILTVKISTSSQLQFWESCLDFMAFLYGHSQTHSGALDSIVYTKLSFLSNNFFLSMIFYTAFPQSKMSFITPKNGCLVLRLRISLNCRLPSFRCACTVKYRTYFIRILHRIEEYFTQDSVFMEVGNWWRKPWEYKHPNQCIYIQNNVVTTVNRQKCYTTQTWDTIAYILRISSLMGGFVRTVNFSLVLSTGVWPIPLITRMNSTLRMPVWTQGGTQWSLCFQTQLTSLTFCRRP